MLVFDGDCAFCTASARWVERRLPTGAVVVPWQRADLPALGLTPEDVATSVWWIDGDGRHRGEVAVARALVAAGRPWSVIGRLLLARAVRPLAGAGYRLVARNRHRLPGGTAACRLPRAP